MCHAKLVKTTHTHMHVPFPQTFTLTLVTAKGRTYNPGCTTYTSTDHTITDFHFQHIFGVLRGSVVKCLNRNPGVLGSCRTGSSGFFSWEYPWARHFRAPA